MKALLYFWLFGLFVKLIVSYFLPLVSDEAYYWFWSHHLQLSYYDHPPFIAWLFRLGHLFENFGHAVRWPAVLLSHFTLLIWCFILYPVISLKKIHWWMELALFSPLIGYGSIVMTPDLPLLFFWSLALLCLTKIEKDTHWGWYIGLGLSLGLGFSSKYHMILFLPCLIVWMFMDGRLKTLKTKWIFISILAGVISSLPVFIWNFQNDFASFRFQLKHGLSAPQWNIHWPLEYIFAQVLLLFPPIFYFSLKWNKTSRLKWLPVFAWGPLIFFLFTSLKGHVEANWPIIAYPAVFALAVNNLQNIKWIRITTFFWSFIVFLISIQSLNRWDFLNIELPKAKEFHEFQPLLPFVEQYQPIFVHSYQMASKLSYDLKRPIYKLKGSHRTDFFDFIAESNPVTDHFFFATETGWSLPYEWQKQGYSVIKKIHIDERFFILEIEKVKNKK